jgi:hypothetical protein
MTSPPETRPGFARLVGGLLWAFALGFLLGAAQVGRALWSGRVWANYRGEFVSQSAMRRELVLFILAALVCALLAWYWHRTWRRGRRGL